MKKWIVIILVIAAGVWGFQQWRSSNGSPGGAEALSRTRTAVAEPRNINFAVTVAGEITPAEQVSVRPEVNGRIELLPVDIGDRVKKGDLLFTLDDSEIRIEISSRETEIASTKLQLERARRDFERDQRLFDQNLVAREVFENSRTEFELAQNAIERSAQAMELAQDRLSKTRIVAPFDCTVLTRPVSVGQAVSGSGGFNSGTEVLTIADLGAMIINAHVNQADVTRLKQGLAVEVQIEAVPGLTLKGVVERISPQATIKNGIKGFAARITLKEVDPRVQPGMTANISIPVESADNVLSVPLSAIFSELNPETGQALRHAFVKSGPRYEHRPVRIGISDYFHVEVLSGLNSGDVVALEPPPKEAIVMKPGAATGTKEVTANTGT
jgi:HlyD family secretion protein